MRGGKRERERDLWLLYIYSKELEENSNHWTMLGFISQNIWPLTMLAEGPADKTPKHLGTQV